MVPTGTVSEMPLIFFADLPGCSALFWPVYLWHLQDYARVTARLHSTPRRYPRPLERSAPGERPCLWFFPPHSVPCRVPAAVSQIRYEEIRPSPPEGDRVLLQDGRSCSYLGWWEETEIGRASC